MTKINTKSSLTLEAATIAIEAGKREAEALGVPMCIAVTDEAGTLVAFARMDGALLLSVAIAIDKAHTACTTGLSTDRLSELVADDPPVLASLAKVPRVILMGGGEVVRADGQVVGAVGASGGDSSEDAQVARAAVSALGLDAE